MRTKFMLAFLCLILIIAACSGGTIPGASSLGSPGISQSGVTEIQLSVFKHFGSVSEEIIHTFEDEESIAMVRNAIRTSNRVSGVVDIAEGNFDLNIVYENGSAEGFHLWLREDSVQGTIMHVDDTHTIYTLSKRGTQRLIDLILPLVE